MADALKTEDTDYVVKVAWGSWELRMDGKPGRGRWHHNPLLTWTAEEQRAMNIANGIPCPDGE